jgi:hypothetical protein
MRHQWPWKKIAVFGLFGAFGCLVGWALGEPFLYVTMSVADSAGAGRAPSLISRPTAPKAEDAAPVGRPVVPPPPALRDDLNKRVEKEGGKSGTVEITLEWYDGNDLDLFCFEPNSDKPIYHAYKKSLISGGVLDIDRNLNCTDNIDTHTPVEHIRWRAEDHAIPREGTYTVVVMHYMRCPGSPATSKYDVTVKCGLDPIQTHSGSITHPGGKNNPSNEVCTFTVSTKAEIFVPQDVELDPGESVRVPVVIRTAFHNGSVGVEALDLPNGVTADRLSIPANKTEGELTLRASSAVPPGKMPIRVKTNGVKDRGSATAQLTIHGPKVEIFAQKEEITFPAGTTLKLPLAVRRSHFKGSVVVEARNLPVGVTASKVTLTPDQTETEIELRAADTIHHGKFTPELVAIAGDTSGSAALALTISTPPGPKFSLWLVTAIGLWTALLAVGLSSSLLVGQNRYLGRSLFAGGRVPLIAAGAAAAGLVSGSIGQTLYFLLLSVGIPEPGFVIGWILLGGLLGWGVSFFIPNLDGKKAAAAGIVGGGLGALAFIVGSRGGEYFGRLVGGAVLGFCIGAMVAIVEAAFRRAWLEVRFGGGEIITVNLGPEPVKVGGDGRQCAVWARGAAPVALRYWIRDGKVVCDDMAGSGERLAANGDRWQAGGVEVIVRTASGATPTRGSPVAEPVAREARPQAKPVVPPHPPAPSTAKPVASPQAAAKPVASPAVTKTPSKTISGYTCPECGSGVDKPVGVCPHCGAMY